MLRVAETDRVCFAFTESESVDQDPGIAIETLVEKVDVLRGQVETVDLRSRPRGNGPCGPVTMERPHVEHGATGMGG